MGRPTLAICGAGMIAGVHAAAAGALGWRTVAVASRSAGSAGRLARAADARVVTVSQLPAGADIVVIATPPASHAPEAIRLLDAGVAVIVEQPLCTTLADADRLVEAADRAGGRALYAANLAYAPIVQRFVTAARSIGVLQHLEVRALQPLPTWRTSTPEDWGGGASFDLAVHPIAVALLVAGNDEVIAVSAVLRRDGAEPDAARLGDDHAELRLRFASGLTARLVARWQAGSEPLWDAQASSATGVVRAEIFPTPVLEVDGEPVELERSSATRTLAPLEHGGYVGQLAAFADDLGRGRPPMTDLRFGRRVLEIVMGAATSSSQDGASIALPFTGPRHHTPLELWRN